MQPLLVNETQTLAALKAGDKRAFDLIYDHYWKQLFLFAFKKVQSEEIAKDLVQDLFVSLWVKKETFIISTSLSAYLFTALKYIILDYIRANITRQNYLSSLKITFLSSPDHSDTADKLTQNEITFLLDQTLESMPPKMKEIFELSRKHGYSIEEIAIKLSISQQTVKNQITNALRKARIALSDYLLFISLMLSLLS